MMTLSDIRKHKAQLQHLARLYHIDPESIRVFGSVARGDMHSNSDIDFLVRPLPECDLFDLAGFHEDIGEILHHQVDVVSERGIPLALHNQILQEAVLV